MSTDRNSEDVVDDAFTEDVKPLWPKDSDYEISLLEFVNTLNAAAQYHGVLQVRRNEVACAIEDAIQAAKRDDAQEVARQAEVVSQCVKDPRSYYTETVKMQKGVRLG